MPRVSKEYREARRDEIARAALRCLERNGVHDTSIADIVEESGLSTGAIYSHFTNKAELARYIVGRFLFPRVDELEAGGRRGVVVAPRQALAGVLAALESTGLPPSVVVQFWGEALTDDEMHAQLVATAGHLLAALSSAVLPWAREQTSSPEAAEDLAARTARTIAALAQGYIANTAVFGPRDPEDYLTSAAGVLAG